MSELLDKAKQQKMYLFLLVLSVSSVMAFQAWRSLFNNFAVEHGGINGLQMGVIQSVREVPGFLALLVIYVLLILKEHRLASVSVILMGIGIAATGYFPSFYGLIFTTILMSVGFHYYETVNQSLSLQYFDTLTSPLVISRLKSLSALASVVAGGVVMLLLKFLEYKYIYLIAGACVVIAGLWSLSVDPTCPKVPNQNKKMVLKKEYGLFYWLTMLAGARRQIFVAFAVFLMVEKFKFSAFEIAALFVTNNIINFLINPYIGRAVNRFGERKVLSLEYTALILVFIAYATVTHKWIVALIYILDHIFYNFSMAIRTYFQKIADPKDIAPSMAVGFTINHIAAVVIPVLGGALWLVDYRIPFICAAVLSLVSLISAQKIETSQS